MDYPHRNLVGARTSYLWHAKKKDGIFLSRRKPSVAERSVRHDDIILWCPCEFISLLATASQLETRRVCCSAGLLAAMGEEMAQTLSGRSGCWHVSRAGLARPFSGAQASPDEN